MEKRGYFITGTDTGIGKTWVTVAFMETVKRQGHTVLGMKPVASGCSLADGNLTNEDALLLSKNASFAVPFDIVNPYAFEPPIAPHIAAEQAGISIGMEKIVAAFKQLKIQSDYVLVEGIGGWQVPLNAQQTVADLAIALQLPVILVVGLRLGCLNHALLTYQAIKRSPLVCTGWVANTVDPNFIFPDENIQTLRQQIDVPLLGQIPYCPDIPPEKLYKYLSNFKYL